MIRQVRLPLETGALLDGALWRESSHRLWCRSVMAVREKCDEKIGRQITSCWEVQWGAALPAVFGKRVVWVPEVGKPTSRNRREKWGTLSVEMLRSGPPAAIPTATSSRSANILRWRSTGSTTTLDPVRFLRDACAKPFRSDEHGLPSLVFAALAGGFASSQ